eukprot:TRINITY_DN12287_c0_g1_i3.p1 TRINITY_DN12287_c0_g1~~TRINITY_DN12287_c0_g1_i3.p1  ORF type:complete len:2350 (+),score=808.06 TRINITY_DN12287_c0_g1_i3:102-7151(+)
MVGHDDFFTDKCVSEETALRRYKKEHPTYLAFADYDTNQQDPNLSREERMLEFELEHLLHTVGETVKLRCATYAQPDFRPTLPAIISTKPIRDLRKERENVIKASGDVPRPQKAVPLGDALLKEVSLSHEPRNTKEYCLSALATCFEKRLAALPLRRYRLLFRWARHCSSSDLLARSDAALRPRLQQLSDDYALTQQALARLDRLRAKLPADAAGEAQIRGAKAGAGQQPQQLRTTTLRGDPGHKGGADDDAGLDPADFRIWLNETCYDERVRRRFSRFSRKCRWLGLHCRWEFFLPCRDAFTKAALGGTVEEDATAAAQRVPTLAASDEVVSAQLDDLTSCFKLRTTGDKDPQEFAHKVDRRFAAVFSAQAAAMEFPPYELGQQKKRGSAAGSPHRGDVDVDDAHPDEATYLVHATWLPHQRLRPRINVQQQRQTCRLFSNAGRVDPQLREENDFLNEHADMQYVLRRLREQAETHVARGAVRREVHSRADMADGAHRDEPRREKRRAGGRPDGSAGRARAEAAAGAGASAEGGSVAAHKRQAVYLLRHIRIREFKRRLLDILNYFASLRRRLCFDSHGYALPCDIEGQGAARPRAAFTREGFKTRVAGASMPGGSEMDDLRTGVVESFTERIIRYSATPADFRAGEVPGPPAIQTLPTSRPLGMGAAAIMQASGIENRDDRYSIKGRSLVVTDRFEQAIMYDIAITDLEDLELELMQVGTHCMQLHSASTPPTEQDVDRISLLEDLFEAEAWYQDAKRKVVDSYMEAYEHVQSPAEQQRLAQVILDTIALRPQLDMDEPYFTQSYTAETINLELHHSLLREIINSQITDEKRNIQSLYRHTGRFEAATHAGLPPPPVADTRLFQAIFPGSSVVNVLDFYGSLDVIADVPELVAQLTESVERRFDVNSALLRSSLQKEVLQHMLIEWKVLAEEERLQRQLQGALLNDEGDSTALLEEGDKVERIVADLISESQGLLSRKGAPDRPEKKETSASQSPVIALWCNVVEAVLCRIELMAALYETEVLYNIHRRQGVVMGVNVRKFQFEAMDFETRKTYPEVDELDNDEVDMAEVVSLRVEYLSHLAIAEFEQSMAALDFHSSEGLKKILSYGVPDVRRALSVQLVQKNLLTAVVLYNQFPIDYYHMGTAYERAKEMLEGSTFVTQAAPDSTERAGSAGSAQWAPRTAPPVVTRFGQQAVGQLGRTGDAGQHVQQTKERRGLAAFPRWAADAHLQRDQLQRLFVSVNHIKSVHRRCILEELNRRTAEILQSKRPELLRKRMKELKHNLIHEYCLGMMRAVYPYALKWQVTQLSHEMMRKFGGQPGPFSFGAAGDLVRHVATTGQQRVKSPPIPQPGGHTEQHACQIAHDGRLENTWYIPHCVQVYTQCNWDQHEAHRDDVKLGAAAGQGGGSRIHEHWHSVDATHLPTTFCLVNMLQILHHLYSISVLGEKFFGLSESASACVEHEGVTERVRTEFTAMQQELEHLSDSSDTTATVQYLEAAHRKLFLRILVSLGRLKKKFLSPAGEGQAGGVTAHAGVRGVRVVGNTKPMHHSLAVVDQALEQLCGRERVERKSDPTYAVGVAQRAAQLKRPEEQTRSDYREAVRRLTDYHLEMLSQGDGDAPGSVSPYQQFDTHFYDSLVAPELGPWLGCDGFLPLNTLGAFMLGLGDEDRRAVLADDENRTEPFLQEVGQDRLFIEEVNAAESKDPSRDRAPDMPIVVARGCAAALELSEKAERLVLFLCVELDTILHPAKPLPDSFDEQFQLLRAVQKKARDHYMEELMDGNDDEGGGAVQADRRRQRRRKQSEVGLRRVQVLVLSQEINRRLLEHWIQYTRGVTEQLTHAAVRQLGERVDDDTLHSEKLQMFSEFHSAIMSRAVSTRQEGAEREVVFKIPEEVICAATDTLGKRIRDWQASHVRGIADVGEAVIQHYRVKLFNAEQRIEHLVRLRELDRKALHRRVQSKVTDEKYELRHRFQTIVKQNGELREQISRMHERARTEIKAEYDERVSVLENDNRLILGQFKDHKKKLYREMQVNLEEIKRQAMMSIGKSEIAPLHMKRQALRIAISDEELNQLKDQNNELHVTITKLKLWHDMKLMNLIGRYEKRIEKLEHEKEEASRRYWGDKAIEREREDEMRSQVNDLQKKLSSAEMEVEQLLRDLDLQERKKKHLVQWKVAHQKEIDDLRRKAKKYEKYEKHDIDKLLNDLEREKERARVHSQDAAQGRRDRDDPAAAAKERELHRLREELKREKRLKVKAFTKLDQMREDQEAITDEMVWQRKYFECASELQRTLRDAASYKDLLTRHGIPIPNLPSRPNSASSGRPPHPQMAEMDADGAPLPHLSARPQSASR